jgi:hypothetical protein
MNIGQLSVLKTFTKLFFIFNCGRKNKDFSVYLYWYEFLSRHFKDKDYVRNINLKKDLFNMGIK